MLEDPIVELGVKQDCIEMFDEPDGTTSGGVKSEPMLSSCLTTLVNFLCPTLVGEYGECMIIIIKIKIMLCNKLMPPFFDLKEKKERKKKRDS